MVVLHAGRRNIHNHMEADRVNFLSAMFFCNRHIKVDGKPKPPWLL